MGDTIEREPMNLRNRTSGWLSALTLMLGPTLPGPAGAAPTPDDSPPNLTGWWMAIDDAYHGAFHAGISVPFEELLVVKKNGAVENRVMRFFGPDYKDCRKRKSICSAAPVAHRAALRVGGNTLSFTDRKPGISPAELFPPVPRFARLLTVSLSDTWSYTLNKDKRQLRLERGVVTRHFVKINPDRLRNLRAAFLAAELNAGLHWRCFLSNATSKNRAFDLTGGPREAPPAWFEDFVSAAATQFRIGSLLQTPTADDPKPDVAKRVSAPVERIMLPPGDDAAPKTRADKQRLAARMIAIARMSAGKTAKQALEQARKLDPDIAAVPIKSEGIAAIKKVLSGLGQRGKNKEVDALFCNDGRKDPALPRKDYDSFAPLRRR